MVMQPLVGQRLEPFATDSAGTYRRETIVICWVCYYDSKCQIWTLHLDGALDHMRCDQSLLFAETAGDTEPKSWLNLQA